MRYLFVIISIVLSSFNIYGQTTENLKQNQISYQKCLELYNEGSYGAASELLLRYIDGQEHNNSLDREANIKKASLLYAKSAVKLGKNGGEKLILNFVRTYAPDPIASGALREMADYYFSERNYSEADKYYNQINTQSLSKTEKNEVIFRKAYLLFVKKKFAAAKSKFDLVNDRDSEYFYPATYYYGLCSFYQNQYEKAIKSFNQISDSRKYSKYIPYYIAQIYFKQKRYDELIRYSTKELDENFNLRNRNEMNQLIGQSYFELGDFQTALPYYEYFMERMPRLRVEDFYQAGYVYYKNQKYEKAKRYFEELGSEKSELGQNGLYHLADCYIKLGDKNSARNAFYKTSQNNYNKAIKEDSYFQYAKLSYELGYDNDAIKALRSISTSSSNYREAQNLLGQLFLNTNNYKKAEDVLSKMSNKSPTLKDAYHKVVYYRGIQEYQAGREIDASRYFKRASEMNNSNSSKAMAYYWLAEISHKKDKYNESNIYLDKFFIHGRGIRLDESSSEGMALYLAGYNYIKLSNYPKAKDFFNRAILKMKREEPQNKYVHEQIMPDAYLRLGDCFFKENNYRLALSNYDKVNVRNNQNYVYALYQKAIIKGLKGNSVESIIDLENIAKKYKGSKYADDALYELGIMYLEIGELNKGRKPLEELVNNYKGKSELVNQAYLKLGLIAYNQGSTTQAINYYKLCLRNNPSPQESKASLLALREIYVDDIGDPDGYFAIQEEMTGSKYSDSGKDSLNYRVAEMKYENGNYSQAITEFGSYIRKYPKGIFIIPAHYYRGECYFINKSYDNSLVDYEYIIKRGHSKMYEDALLKAALISYNHAENFDKALEYYMQLDKVAQSQENKFKAQIGAMRSAYKLGSPDQLEQMAQKVIGNNLANNEQKGIAHYYLGKINYDRQRLSAAEVNFEKAKLYLNNIHAAEARYYVAEIAYQKGQLDIAKTKCMSANQQNTSYSYWLAKGVILLSDILKDQHDYFNAKAALESLIENYTEDADLIAIAKAKLATLEQLDSRNLIAPNSNNGELELEEN